MYKLLLVCFCSLLTVLCQAEIFTVDDDGPADFNNIQAAINASTNSDIIIVQPGTYIGNGNYNIDFLGKAVTVQSIDPNNPDIVVSTVIDCQGKGLGFYLHSGEDHNSVINGLTITRGQKIYPCGQFAFCSVGGVRCISSSPKIRNCLITGNYGFGIHCTFGGSVLITKCIISDNNEREPLYGGADGIYCDGTDLTLENSTITGNSLNGINCYRNESKVNNCIISDNQGYGGIYFSHSNFSIYNCTISNNINQIFGSGGITCMEDCTGIISNCVISGNSGISAGISFYQDEVVISNCVISGNTGYVGGIYSGGVGITDVVNCTIVNNHSTGYGGGIECYGSNSIVTNSILWYNTTQTQGPQIALRKNSYSHTSSMNISFSDVQGGKSSIYIEPDCVLNWGIGNTDTDPCFVNPGYWDPNGTPADANDDFWVNGDYHLKSEGWRWDSARQRWDYDDVTSRCIDAGNPGCPLGDELLSVPEDPDNIWGVNIRIDMGAYGGTSKASIPPYGWSLLADLTNDGAVDFNDFSYQADDWLKNGECLPGDLNRDSVIDLADTELLIKDWLNKTIWHVE